MEERLQQQIEDYLDGKLSKQARLDFEAEMQKDKNLADEVALFREMEDLLGETDVLDFSNTLDTVMGATTIKTTQQEAIIKPLATKKNSNRRWLSLAAGFALVAVLGTLIYNNLASTTPATIYANHIDFPAALGGGSTLRSTEGVVSDNAILNEINAYWKTANATYQQNDFVAALSAIDAISKIDPNFEVESRDDYFFKKGLVQLKANQPTEAIRSFEQVTSGDYVANAEWKHALALLTIDVAKAKIALEKIANSKHPDSATARAILNKL